jgi:hypothetical protein
LIESQVSWTEVDEEEESADDCWIVAKEVSGSLGERTRRKDAAVGVQRVWKKSYLRQKEGESGQLPALPTTSRRSQLT